MEKQTIKSKLLCGVLCGTMLAVLFVIAVTIGADLYLPLKDWLKNTFSHHWIGKGVLAGIIFLIGIPIGFLIPTPSDEAAKTARIVKRLWALSLVSFFGATAIFAFFVYESFFKH